VNVMSDLLALFVGKLCAKTTVTIVDSAAMVHASARPATQERLVRSTPVMLVALAMASALLIHAHVTQDGLMLTVVPSCARIIATAYRVHAWRALANALLVLPVRLATGVRAHITAAVMEHAMIRLENVHVH